MAAAAMARWPARWPRAKAVRRTLHGRVGLWECVNIATKFDGTLHVSGGHWHAEAVRRAHWAVRSASPSGGVWLSGCVFASGVHGAERP
eukprot:354756-Chlamydomonas_euryale.AAC.2